VPDATEDEAADELVAFGSSEYAKVLLGKLWGKPPALDLDAEADLHTLLRGLADRKLIHSARDISDGGIAASLAQAAFTKGIGATVEQDASLLAHPLFGLFAEPATTVLLTATEKHLGAIEKLAGEFKFLAVRIGTTGGDRLEVSVDHQPLISASIAELRAPWAQSLEAALHDEVTA
jgi:phosphoribosylformylglycinamidine synthase